MSPTREIDFDLVAELALLLPQRAGRLSAFERDLAFEVLDRFSADPAGLVITRDERAALEPAVAAMAVGLEAAA
ncbi:MAG: hypothetical protein ACK4RV_11665 [Caulobacter sp.]